MNIWIWSRRVFAIVVYGVLTFAYLRPGSDLLFADDRTRVMSDDTDPSTLPHAYASLLRAFDRDKTSLLYGAIAMDQGHPQRDSVTWFSWVERWLVVGLRPWVSLEQMSTALVFALLVFTALSFFGLARAWRTSWWAALALGAAWAFCPFTRARAKVHPGMVGTYHWPLIFLGLHLVTRRRDRRSVALAALCFLMASTTLQYFVINAAALTPFLLMFVWASRGRRPVGRVARRLVAAALPAVLFLTWNVLAPLAPGSNVAGDPIFPTSGDVPTGELHPFLTYYSARPIDYLGSDIALTGPSGEMFSPKAWVNDYILSHPGPQGIPHERTNGIRWTLLALALVGFYRAWGRPDRRVGSLAIFGFACFWLSLSPDAPFPHFGPSGWLWRWVHSVRVPSRAGIGVHFAVLSIVALTLKSHARERWRRLVAILLPLAVVIEYPPWATPMPIVPMRPRYAHLNARGTCATGLLFPFVNDQLYMLLFYHFKQQLRDTGCTFLNGITERSGLNNLYRRFPTSPDYVRGLEGAGAEAAANQIVRLARCAPLGWIAFDPVTPASFREKVCAQLGWPLYQDLTCVASEPVPPMGRSPDACP